MSNNVLPDSVIVAIVYFLLQLGKPLLNGIVPQEATYQNNVVRAVGFLLTYILVSVNFLVTHPLRWPDLWGLLPVAGAVYGASVLLYHVQDDNGTVASGAPPSADSQDRRLLAVPAEAQVSVLVPPRPAPSTSGAMPVSPVSSAPTTPPTTSTDSVPPP